MLGIGQMDILFAYLVHHQFVNLYSEAVKVFFSCKLAVELWLPICYVRD